MDLGKLQTAARRRLREQAKKLVLQGVPLTQAPYVIKGAPILIEGMWQARRLMTPVSHVTAHQDLVKTQKETLGACPLCGGACIRLLCQAERRKDDGTIAWSYQAGQCPDCGLLRRFPAIKASRVADLYKGKGYNAFLSGTYAADRVRRYRLTIDAFDQFVAKGAGRRLLDFGCGNGLFLELAEKRGYETWGVDIGPDNVDAARERLGHDRVFQGEVDDVPAIADGGFDIITMWSVLAHLADPAAVLARLRRLLNPGGVLLILTVNAQSLQLRTFRGGWSGFTRNHLMFFDHRTLPRLLQSAGFSGVAFRMFYGETIEAGTTKLSKEQAARYRNVVDSRQCGNMMRAVAVNGPTETVPLQGIIELSPAAQIRAG